MEFHNKNLEILSGVVIDINKPFQCVVGGVKKICFYYSLKTDKEKASYFMGTMGLVDSILPPVDSGLIYILYKDNNKLCYADNTTITDVITNLIIDYNNEDMLDNLDVHGKGLVSKLVSAQARVSYLIYCKFGIIYQTGEDLAKFWAACEDYFICELNGEKFEILSDWMHLSKKEFIKIAKMCYIDNNRMFHLDKIKTTIKNGKYTESLIS